MIRVYLRAVVGRQMILFVGLFDETHSEFQSRGLIAWNARLKRSEECQRRERDGGLLL
jgi:hypothetical protein